MKTIRVKLKENGYPILIGQDIFKKLPQYLQNLSLGKDAVIISHSNIERLHGRRLAAVLLKAGYSVKFFNVAQGEESKSAACALGLIERIASYDVNRKIFIIALGGGVIGDLAGFVAAIYKRGVPYIQVPTTLLAQIDSSIGGKTGIDLKQGKNLVGAIYQPKAVVIDTTVLKTLNIRQIRNGLAEAIKYGVIKDAGLFNFLEKNYLKLLKNDSTACIEMIYRCAQIKADVVSLDEKETKGIRTILNFGHTVGHAIEAASDFRYHHGESVALGMRAAAKISVLQKLFSPSQEKRLNDLITRIGLPSKMEKMNQSEILEIMKHDKKFVAGRNRFVLVRSIGKVLVVTDVPTEAIIQSIKSIS